MKRLAKLLSKIELNFTLDELQAVALGFMADAEKTELKGLAKRHWVAKRVAVWVDEQIKLPFLAELFDGLVAYILALFIQLLFDKYFKKDAEKA